MSGGIVDHVDLAGVETGFQLGEGYVELENRGFAVGRIQLAALDQRSLIRFRLAAEEGDIGQQANGRRCDRFPGAFARVVAMRAGSYTS